MFNETPIVIYKSTKSLHVLSINVSFSKIKNVNIFKDHYKLIVVYSKIIYLFYLMGF